MVKSSAEEIWRLRAEVVELAGGVCEWGHCDNTGRQMAHIRGKGMGGSKEANRIDNLALLCRHHHDVLDGRTYRGTREAVADLLAAHVKTRRGSFGG